MKQDLLVSMKHNALVPSGNSAAHARFASPCGVYTNTNLV